jgi:hypothetical protein
MLHPSTEIKRSEWFVLVHFYRLKMGKLHFYMKQKEFFKFAKAGPLIEDKIKTQLVLFHLFIK